MLGYVESVPTSAPQPDGEAISNTHLAGEVMGGPGELWWDCDELCESCEDYETYFWIMGWLSGDDDNNDDVCDNDDKTTW